MDVLDRQAGERIDAGERRHPLRGRHRLLGQLAGSREVAPAPVADQPGRAFDLKLGIARFAGGGERGFEVLPRRARARRAGSSTLPRAKVASRTSASVGSSPSRGRGRQGRVEVLDRLLERVHRRGRVAGAAVVVERPPIVARDVGVVGDHPCELVDSIRVQRLDRVDRGSVELLAPAPQQARGRRSPGSACGGRRRTAPASGRRRRSSSAARSSSSAVADAVRDPLEQRDRELAAEDRGDAEQLLRRRGEPVDPGADQLLDRLRDLDRDLAVEAPAPAARSQRADSTIERTSSSR